MNKTLRTLFVIPFFIIGFTGIFEISALYVINEVYINVDKFLASLSTILIGSLASILLLAYSNYSAKNLGSLYFKFLIISFLKSDYNKKVKIDLEQNISSLVINPVKFYRNVFSSIYQSVYCFVALITSLTAAVYFLGVDGMRLPLLLILLYTGSLWFSKKLMKKLGREEDRAQDLLVSQLDLYHTDMRFFYSYKQNGKILSTFTRYQEDILNSVYLQAIINQLPKSILTFVIIAASLIYFFLTDVSVINLDKDALLGVLLLIRSVGPGQSLVSTFNNIFYYQGSIQEVKSIFRSLVNNKDHIGMLEESEIRKSRVRDFFQIEHGGIWLRGDSGIGKSRLLDKLSGLLDANTYDGTLVTGSSIFYDTDLLSNITLKKTSDREDRSKVRTLMQLLDLKLDLDKNYGHGKNVVLSNGERQRVMLARALFRWKEVLIIDEATYSFPEPIKENLFRYLNSETDKVWVLVSHQQEDQSFFASVYEMKKEIQ